MNEIIDSEITSNSLAELVESYISLKRNGNHTDTSTFRNALNKMGFSVDQQDDLLIEMDDDADKEMLAGVGVKKAKSSLIIGLCTGILGIALCILVAFMGVSMGNFFIPFGIIAAAFIAAGRAYAEIGMVEKRMKRRSLKYQNWI